MKQVAVLGRVSGKGAATGVLATAVMSVVFVGTAKLGLLDRKPPRIIVDHFLPDLPKVSADRLALAAHFTYGAVWGAVFAALPLAANRSAACRAGCGTIYGVAGCATSYEGPPRLREEHARS